LRTAVWAVTAQHALGMIGQRDVALIDVRERSERERHGVIPGPLHVPYPSLQQNISAGGMLRELLKSTTKRLLFYCAFGERSAMAMQRRRMRGFRRPAISKAALMPGRQASGR
jgi:sulfur dioxygenase